MAEPSARIKHKKNRLEAFSDGVFAIAITLLVLEIAVPAIRETSSAGDALWGIGHEWPVYLACFVSFMTIGAVWIEHSALVDALDHIDGVFVRLNHGGEPWTPSARVCSAKTSPTSARRRLGSGTSSCQASSPTFGGASGLLRAAPRHRHLPGHRHLAGGPAP